MVVLAFCGYVIATHEPDTKTVVRKMGNHYLVLRVYEDGTPYASLKQSYPSNRYYWSTYETILFAKWFTSEKAALDAIEQVRQGYDPYHDVEVPEKKSD